MPIQSRYNTNSVNNTNNSGMNKAKAIIILFILMLGAIAVLNILLYLINKI